MKSRMLPVLFVLLLLHDFGLPGTTRPRQMITQGDRLPLRSYLLQLPYTVQQALSYYQLFRARPRDRHSPAETPLPESLLWQTVFHNDLLFAKVAPEDLDSLQKAREVLEFYDDEVQSQVRWFAGFLGSQEWQAIESRSSDSPLVHQADFVSPEQRAELHQRQMAFYRRLLEEVATVPEAFRRPWKDLRRRLDEPAAPESGYAALQSAFLQALDGQPIDNPNLVLVRVLIDEQGRLLRARIHRSSGAAAIDSIALAVVQGTSWRPAMLEGKPFKTESVIPLRLWPPSR